MNIFKKRKLVPTEHDKLQDATYAELNDGVTILKSDITDIQSDITDINNELFLNDNDDASYDGEWDTSSSYGTVTFSGTSNNIVELKTTTTPLSDAGVFNLNPFNIRRNNYQLEVTALADREEMVILSISDVKFKNVNQEANWPAPNFGTSVLTPIQHGLTDVSAYNWLRSSEIPSTTNSHDQSRTTLLKDETILITIVDGELSFSRRSANGSTIISYNYTNNITLPLNEYYIGLHMQSASTQTSEYSLKYRETTRNSPYSRLNELESNLIYPRKTRYIISPSLNNRDYPNFYCDKYTRYVIANPTGAFNLVLPSPDTTEDFIFTIKNIANQSFTLELPTDYKWGNTYNTSPHTLANHKTIDILFNPVGLLGDFSSTTASAPIKLCHILHEATTINNP